MTTTIDRETATEAIAQFVAAAHSRVQGDREAEQRATAELRRLGVRVEWGQPESGDHADAE